MSTFQSLINAASAYEAARREAIDSCNEKCARAREEYHKDIAAAKMGFDAACEAAQIGDSHAGVDIVDSQSKSRGIKAFSKFSYEKYDAAIQSGKSHA
jgi:hypothetical protein